MDDKQLLGRTIAAPRWAVDGLIPEGLTMLAGQPKAGKSYTSLDAAMSCASGRGFLGFDTPRARDVLYLALEDSVYRLQSRLRAWYARTDEQPTGNIEFLNEWPSAAEGGIEQLVEYCQDFPNLGMIVIDTLGIFAPVAGSFNKAYPALTKLSKLGREHHVAVVVVHHAYRGLRVRSNKPAMESIQGSIGASAAADSILVLARESDTDTGALFVTGKDVESGTVPLVWRKGGGWDRQGAAEERPSGTPLQRDIITYIKAHPGQDVPSIAAGMGKTRDAIRQRLWQMNKSGQLVREDGRYSAP